MQDLTALVLTYNERENIERTLRALTWLPRVLIVDSFSIDDTCARAHAFSNVEIVQRKFDTHTDQWNFGLDQIVTDWVLTLDADYEVSSALATEIQKLELSSSIAGYAAAFDFRIFGHSLRTSVYPPRTVLFEQRRGRYVQDGHTQLLQLDGPVATFGNVIYHDDRKALSRWIQSQDRYTKIEAKHLLKLRSPEGGMRNQHISVQDRLRLKIYFAPAVMFLYLLFGRGLIFDGWPGWYYVMQRTIAEMLLSLRLLTERHRLEETE
ncbi:MAG: glycosyltransferase family 2 protein [Chthoniobacterales bacterium]